MDFGRAFAFVTQDADWPKKILIGGLISLIPIAGALIVYGYVLEIVRNAYSGQDERMPEWDDLAGYIVRGLIVIAGLVIWMLPIIVLGICVGIAAGIFGESSDVVASLFALFGSCLMVILIVVYTIVFIPIVAARYAIHRAFSSMFEFNKIIEEARRAGALLLLLLLIVIVAQFVATAGYLVCLIGVIFTSFYSQLVMGHAAGQLYRGADGGQSMPDHATF